MIITRHNSRANLNHKIDRRFLLSAKASKGFTLTEVILALSIMALLISGIFGITQSILSLSQTSLENQNFQRHISTLESYFRTLYRDLPRNSVTELKQDDQNYPLLNIQNPGTFYPGEGKDQLATFLSIRTIKNRDGFLALQASWSKQDLSELNLENSLPDFDQTLTLVDNLTSLEWQIYSTSDREWYTIWGPELARPSHIRLKYSIAENQQQYTHTFWVPPKP